MVDWADQASTSHLIEANEYRSFLEGPPRQHFRKQLSYLAPGGCQTGGHHNDAVGPFVGLEDCGKGRGLLGSVNVREFSTREMPGAVSLLVGA